jgi:hypothetical protein
MARAVSGDGFAVFLEDGPKVLNTHLKAIFTVGYAPESSAKGHGVTTVPSIVNEGVNNPMHTGQTFVAPRELALLGDGFMLADPRFIR